MPGLAVKREFSARQMLLAFALWWSIWIVIDTYIIHYMGIDYLTSFYDSIVVNLLLAGIGAGMFNSMRFYRPDNENYFYLRLWILLLSIGVTALQQYLFTFIGKGNTTYLELAHKAVPIRFCFNFLMISFVSLLNWLWYYFKSLEEETKRQSDAEKLAKEAELTMLRQQLQPHFLFNSLNSISALAGSRPEEARHMIQQLSDFLRGTLRKDEGQLVSLEEEISHLQLYLEIEKVRFGHRLNTEIKTGDDCRKKMIPHLLLQPLVENAIKFGLYDTTEAITIHIETTCTEQELHVSITNPFDPATSAPRQGTGFGLNSIQRRLYLLYARQDLVQTKINNRTFTTFVNIPQHDKSSAY
jgi:two-component system LytT family sensor kinase